MSLNHLGCSNSEESDIISESKLFVMKCYNAKRMDRMSDIIKWLWEKKTNVAKLSSKPKLCTLPQTDEALELNIKRAHYQTMFMVLLQSDPPCIDPPCIDPIDYGWEPDHETRTIKPVILPNGVHAAPEKVMRNTRCTCKSSKCSSCSCVKGTIGCTVFCGCKEYGECSNLCNICEDNIVDSDESCNENMDETDEIEVS